MTTKEFKNRLDSLLIILAQKLRQSGVTEKEIKELENIKEDIN